MDINFNFEQLVKLVLQLPNEQASELEKVLKRKLKTTNKSKKQKNIGHTEEFRNLLLNGPVMTEEENQRFIEKLGLSYKKRQRRKIFVENTTLSHLLRCSALKYL